MILSDKARAFDAMAGAIVRTSGIRNCAIDLMDASLPEGCMSDIRERTAIGRSSDLQASCSIYLP